MLLLHKPMNGDGWRMSDGMRDEGNESSLMIVM